MNIEIKSISEQEKEALKISAWPIWEKGVSEFDWYYDDTEVCYILEGRVYVSTPDGKEVEINADDYVTFPKGLSCKWKIVEPIRKHYNFER